MVRQLLKVIVNGQGYMQTRLHRLEMELTVFGSV